MNSQTIQAKGNPRNGGPTGRRANTVTGHGRRAVLLPVSEAIGRLAIPVTGHGRCAGTAPVIMPGRRVVLLPASEAIGRPAMPATDPGRFAVLPPASGAIGRPARPTIGHGRFAVLPPDSEAIGRPAISATGRGRLARMDRTELLQISRRQSKTSRPEDQKNTPGQIQQNILEKRLKRYQHLSRRYRLFP
jgi:hypothetical protein